jgi:tetratricopeptide (TPR) repeat protein
MGSFHRAETISWPSAVCAAVIAAHLCLGCVSPGATVPPPEGRVDHLKQQLSLETRREQAAIINRSLLYREHQLEQFLERILASLMPAEVPEGIVPRVVLVRELSLDAYSFPDGAIFLHTGLLARLEGEPELALLLAHELVHITRQHALQALAAFPPESDASVFNRVLSDALSWFQDTAPRPGMGKPSEDLLSLRRSLEQEADRMGLDMIIQAGYDPYKATEIFDNLIEDRGDRPGKERVAALLQPLSTTDFSQTGRSTDRGDFGKRLQALLLEQGWLELRYGRWDGALQCAHRVVRDAPTNGRGHYLLGEILRRRNEAGDVPQAFTHYLQAIAADPSLPEPYKAIGLIHFKQGQTRVARGFFEKALELAPHSRDNDYIRSYLDQCAMITEGEDL